ncbi:MAG TPA: diacylglycerol kinase family protein [Gemmatimonadaceae bacterium]|nr:diacylglycerol kinase family protein [Gemmatimonadaceae bacterium]
MSGVEILALVNSEAGTAEDACHALDKSGAFRVERIAPKELATRVRRAVESGAPRIVIAGGDGSIATAAGALRGKPCELAILPGGTLNHLAQDLGLPTDLDEAVRVAAGPTTRRIDIADVNGRLFLNTSSVGAYVTYVRTRERFERRLGYWLASAAAAFRILFRLRSFRVTLEVNGKEREYMTPLVFVGVGERELKLPTLGKRVENGCRGLHVMVVQSRSAGRVLALAFAAAARGVKQVSQTPEMQSFIVDSVRIEPKRRVTAWNIAVDGEIVRVTPPLEYRLVRDGLKVVVAETPVSS